MRSHAAAVIFGVPPSAEAPIPDDAGRFGPGFSVEEVLRAALALPGESRQQLLDKIVTSLEAEGDGPALTQAMENELAARVAEMRASKWVDVETFLSCARR